MAAPDPQGQWLQMRLPEREAKQPPCAGNENHKEKAPAVFISVTDPTHTKTGHLRKLIRSHAAHVGHGRQSHGNVAKRRPARKTVIFEIETGGGPCSTRAAVASTSTSTSSSSSSSLSSPSTALSSSKSSSAAASRVPSISPEQWRLIGLPLERLLGGGRVDPFKSYPVPWEPFIPNVIDYYLMNLAVDCDDLDQPENRNRLRYGWFPLAMSDPAIFQAVLLMAASHYISLCGKDGQIPNLIALKGKTIAYINDGLANKEKCLSDAMIGAVAKMASYEAIFGDVESWQIHMTGLMRMVQLRGGLENLGVGGLLARMILWIDTNSSFVLNKDRFFDEQDTIRMPPNPGMFLGTQWLSTWEKEPI